MFSDKDVEVMTLPYFNVIRADKEEFEIQSRNTGHFWMIIPDGREYRLMHKYHKEDDYHVQTYMLSVIDLVLDIINHDDYKLHGSRLKRLYSTKEGDLFKELTDKYCFA